jgi:thiol-disulfide isomerase/thioredoxin
MRLSIRFTPRRSAAVFVAAVTVLLASAAALGAQESGIPVGTPAPSAAVETLDGQAADLSTVFGTKPVLIEFWATWCGVCKALEPSLMAVRAKYADRVTFVGVAVSVNQSPERVRRYAAQYMAGFTQFYDRRGFAVEAYDVPATSYIVIVDAAGKVVYTGLGSDQELDRALAAALVPPRQ